MEFQREKTVRFSNDGKKSLELPPWERKENKKVPVYRASAPLLKSEGGFNEKVKGTGGPKFGRFKIFPEDSEPEKYEKWILDPGSEHVLQWNRIFLFFCLVALFVDPLFFYLPSVVNDALPLPQVVIWFLIPAIRSSHADHTNNALVLIVLLQYIPRFYLIFPLSSQIIKATGVVTKTAWAGAAYNLILYMLASHVFYLSLILSFFPLEIELWSLMFSCIFLVHLLFQTAAVSFVQILGASWYLLSIERHATCWKSACKKDISPVTCVPKYLDCGTLNHDDRMTWANSTLLFSTCDPENETFFNYGIFGNAVRNHVLSVDFLDKYLYCLWWGLQNLSSYGQTLTTSTFVGETIFAIPHCHLWLVLFAHLIGNIVLLELLIWHCVQTYLQSITVRLEEWRLKRRDTEEWMRHRQLPQNLQHRSGIYVPFFSQMDNLLLDAICERLLSSLSTQGTYIVREGDPVSEMLFIIRGTLESSTTNGGRTGFFNSITLKPGDFCGEELLAWALLPKSVANLPSSTRTVKALTEVEAFALLAEDLKFVANQFRRLHSKKLQHTFRYYSHHWRTWAACFIQAAWRRHKKRVMIRDLWMRESFNSVPDEYTGDEGEEGEERSSDPTATSTSQVKQHLGVTILASRFAANTRRGVQKVKDVGMPTLQKPEEPNFSDDE
ncbi:hypothetical protein Leryth_010480 [Lithospermum erythrorhizon]|nr:hypothetical protein Leryth_010480 [Lithospermum erythrorhizon]